ncbi:MAG TPA: pseudouridine synthase [Terriglobales bacterium]|jgi:23S rRNA pseudouridine2605 synthase
MKDQSRSKSRPQPEPQLEDDRRIGLARAISKLGYCSRSRAVELVRAGQVRLNEKVCRNPEAPTRAGKDRIEVEGGKVQESEKIYLMLNKPRGIVTTASDEKGRETIYSLLPEKLPWIAPVGRLDKSSEGLLLLTNDSAWAARILDPESQLEKTYHVQVNTVAHERLLQKLQEGVREEGELLRAKRATILRGGEKNTWLEIVLEEGKNRQIRRMLEALNLEVLRLVRVSIGTLALGNLAKGKTRVLTQEEKTALC